MNLIVYYNKVLTLNLPRSVDTPMMIKLQHSCNKNGGSIKAQLIWL